MTPTNGRTLPSPTPAYGETRMIPRDIEAERALLGSIMLDSSVVPEVLQSLSRDDADAFFDNGYATLWSVLLTMYDAMTPIDILTLRNECARREKLADIGGVDALVALAESVPSAANAGHYAAAVRDKMLLRRVISVTGKLNAKAYDATARADDVLDEAAREVNAMIDRRIIRAADPIRRELEEMPKMFSDDKAMTGLPMGWSEIDDLLSGLSPGELTVIAGRPSMGKSAFGLNVAEHAAEVENVPTMFFTLEMSRLQLVTRLLCATARIDSHKLRRRMLSSDEREHLTREAERLASVPLYIDDTPALQLFDFAAKCRQAKQSRNIGLVVVDYLQLMTSPRCDSRREEVGAISRGLKAVAKNVGVPIVALAQLNRATEDRTDKRPSMSNLRESGDIEQDADNVILLHRPEYYLKDKTPDELRGVAEIVLDKNRNGPTGIVKLHWNPSHQVFSNLSRQQYEQADRLEESMRRGEQANMWGEREAAAPF